LGATSLRTAIIERVRIARADVTRATDGIKLQLGDQARAGL
jgi:hypothetical protein